MKGNKILAQVVNKTKNPNKAQTNKVDEYLVNNGDTLLPSPQEGKL